MKKIKFCVAAVALSLLLSGCGMARDGIIEEKPAETREPIESPYITTTPRPTERPADTQMTGGDSSEETPAPDRGTGMDTAN